MWRTMVLAVTVLAVAIVVPTVVVDEHVQQPVEREPRIVAQPSAQPADTVQDASPCTGGGFGYGWWQVDPATLYDAGGAQVPLPGGDPWLVAIEGRHAFSFDRRWLVVIDLEAWEVTQRLPTAGHPVSGATAFLPDGRLVWLGFDGEGYGPAPATVFAYRVGDPEPVRLGVLPDAFQPNDLAVVDEDHLAVVGVEAAAGDRERVVPWLRIVQFDLRSGEVVGDIHLDGVQAGWFPGDTEFGEWVYPGIAWDLPQRRVHVVHADDDVVSSVDLDTLAREVHDFGAPTGVRALFPGWFARSASAKGPTLGVQRQAVLSPDGRHLYVTGVRWEPVHDANGNLRDSRPHPLGVWTLDTAAWTVTARAELPVENLLVSLDGARVAATNPWRPDGDLYLLQAPGLEVVERLQFPGWFGPDLEGFLDGALVVSMWNGDGDSNIARISASTGEISAQRRSTEGRRFHWILPELGVLVCQSSD
jgi:hypothetical protein